MSESRNSYLPFLLLFIQPIFMASNLVVARGGVEYVPPISLAFWRWLLVFFILLPFTFSSLKKNFSLIKKEYKQIFFIGSMGVWCMWCFSLFSRSNYINNKHGNYLYIFTYFYNFNFKLIF